MKERKVKKNNLSIINIIKFCEFNSFFWHIFREQFLIFSFWAVGWTEFTHRVTALNNLGESSKACDSLWQ